MQFMKLYLNRKSAINNAKLSGCLYRCTQKPAAKDSVGNF